jgi:hypothetical protein
MDLRDRHLRDRTGDCLDLKVPSKNDRSAVFCGARNAGTESARKIRSLAARARTTKTNTGLMLIGMNSVADQTELLFEID